MKEEHLADEPNLGMNLNTSTMKEVYDKFGLEATTRDFIGHSMALYQTDDYINEKGTAKEAITRIRLYVNSMARYGKSPYIYPLYGLGELPQGFARLSAIYGGTYMLNTDIDEILYDGKHVSGIKATMKDRGDEKSEGMKFTTKCKKIIADPSYFPQKVSTTGYLLKAICILNHPVASTDNNDSLQLIIPQSQVGRKNGRFAPYQYRNPFLWSDKVQTYTLPLFPRHTMSAPRATILQLFQPLPRQVPITILSSSPASSVSERLRRNSWDHLSRCMSHWIAAIRTASSSAGAMTRQVTLRPQQVRFQPHCHLILKLTR